MAVLISPPPAAQKIQSVALGVLAFAAAIALLYYGRALCITLLVSVMISFILEPFVASFMRMRLPRAVASFVVCVLALLIVYLIGLGAWVQLSGIYDELPLYSQRLNQVVDNVAERLEKAEQNAYRLLVPRRFQEKAEQQPPPEPKRRRRAEPAMPPPVQEVRIQQERPSIASYVYSYVSSLYNVLLMMSFVPFLVYFMLSWRDHLRRVYLSMYEGTDRVVAGKSWEGIANMARGYMFGNFLLGLILSAASCIAFWSWHIPYWPLVGPLSGFLSLIPYIGLPLAMAPPLVAALALYQTVTPFVIIGATVGFLHLLGLNLLYPMIVGSRVHLNPLAVTIALMFWGTLWGGVGLVLAIPITAGFKAVFDNVESLQSYGKLLGD
ncbi:MAG TPA: AI-2E family transporter [Bryobacteraceae bacterium]|nr:AI-2E family transporter [Bryobacteraceae bacterium]